MRLAYAALGFLLCAAYVPGWLDPAEAPRWIVLSVFAPALLLALPLTYVSGTGWVIAFLAYADLTIAWSAVPYESINAVWQLLLLVMGFAIGTQARDAHMKALWLGAAVGMALSSVAVMAQSLGWDGVMQAPGAAPAGLFVNSNVLSWTAAMVFVALIGRGQLIAAMLIIPCFLCWFISPYQGEPTLFFGNITGLLGVLAALVAWPKLSVHAKAPLVLALAIAGIVGVMLRSDQLYHRLEYARQTLIHLSWLGWGAGSWTAEYPLVSGLRLEDWRPEHAHSDIVEIVAEYGIGAILLVPLVARIARNIGSSAESLALVACGVCALAGFPLHQPATGFLAACCAGFLCVARDHVFGDARERANRPVPRMVRLSRSGVSVLSSGHLDMGAREHAASQDRR